MTVQGMLNRPSIPHEHTYSYGGEEVYTTEYADNDKGVDEEITMGQARTHQHNTVVGVVTYTYDENMIRDEVEHRHFLSGVGSTSRESV